MKPRMLRNSPRLLVGWPASLIILSLVVASCGAPPVAPQRVIETVVVTQEVRVPVTQVVEITPVPLTEVDTCFSAASGTMAVAWYAYENGLFEKYGLDVNLTFIASGSKAATAMIAGDVEFCQIAGNAVTAAAVAGADLVMIGGLFNTYTYSLMVNPDIATAEDLKGKTLGISRPGSSSDAALRAALKSLGLDPDVDVTIVAIGSEPERIAALEVGAIAGTVINVPESSEAKAKGFKELADLSTLGIPFQHTGIATTRAYIESNRAVVVNFMKAIVEAIAMMKKDKEGTLAVIADYLLLDPEESEASLNEAYDVLVVNFLPQAPYPTLDGIQTLLTAAAEEDPNAANFKPEAVADLSIVQELEDSGFIADLYK